MYSQHTLTVLLPVAFHPLVPPLPAPKIKSDSEPAWKGAAYKLQTSGGAQKELAWQ